MEGHRFGAAVCHRRFGKTVAAVNQLQKAALTCTKIRPRFAYLAPYYRQGKSGAWDYMKHYASGIPGAVVNESELRIDYPNGGQVRIYGADNPDSLRGIYLDGAVLDEFGLMPPDIYSAVIRPTLSDRLGWAFFLGTPNGKNQFYDLIHGAGEWQGAKADPAWFFAEYKASESGVIPLEELALNRAVQTPEEYAQEYECSFEASVKGAVYARELLAAREAGRLSRVPYDPALLVDTDWDLGVGDATAIWFSQSLGTGEVRLIDYYEANGHGLPHFKQVLNTKGFTYGVHWAPHDIQARELTTGHTRLEAARQLGIPFQITPRVESLEDGIHAARMLLPRCWFDADKCKGGIEALQNYRWKPRDLVANPTGKPLPVHDWSSHGADAFRGLAYRHYGPRKQNEKAVLRAAQRDSDPYDKRVSVRFRAGGRAGY